MKPLLFLVAKLSVSLLLIGVIAWRLDLAAFGRTLAAADLAIVALAAAQLLLTTSLRFGSAATVIVMDYTALLWATLYGWQVFDELPVPNTWIGAPLIILAGTIILVREGHLARKARRARLDVPAPEDPLAQQQR